MKTSESLKLPDRFPPAGYVGLLKIVTIAAARKGYAVALHGSLSRDMDLIAIPWKDGASSALELVAAIQRALGLNDKVRPFSENKAHGRVAFCIDLSGGAYIDLSVMPRKVKRK